MSLWTAFRLEVLRQPVLVLLIGGGAIYMLLGEPQDAVTRLPRQSSGSGWNFSACPAFLPE